VSAEEIDQYLDSLDEHKRSTLARLRQTILAALPEAEQGMSYGLPAFKVGGKTIAGFAAFKNHLSYLPHSGSVFPAIMKPVAARPGGARTGTHQARTSQPAAPARPTRTSRPRRRRSSADAAIRRRLVVQFRRG
jgi:hypothetical protein